MIQACEKIVYFGIHFQSHFHALAYWYSLLHIFLTDLFSLRQLTLILHIFPDFYPISWYWTWLCFASELWQWLPACARVLHFSQVKGESYKWSLPKSCSLSKSLFFFFLAEYLKVTVDFIYEFCSLLEGLQRMCSHHIRKAQNPFIT